MGDMWEFSRQECATIVDSVLRGYQSIGLKDLTEDLHFAELTDIYGTLNPDIPAEVQFRNQGAVIATLFWKLAQDRGLVGSRVA